MKRVLNESSDSVCLESKKTKDEGQLIDISEEVTTTKVEVLLKNPDKNQKYIEQEFKNLQKSYVN